MEAVARMCNRVLLMEAGRIVADGPAEQVIQEYHFRGRALESAEHSMSACPTTMPA
jgi:ABC-type glutathione transport system ATPase component